MVRTAGPAAIAAGLGEIKGGMDGKTARTAINGDRGGLVEQQGAHADRYAGEVNGGVCLGRRVRGKIQAGAGFVLKGEKNTQFRVVDSA